jgi:hypothetical protein
MPLAAPVTTMTFSPDRMLKFLSCTAAAISPWSASAVSAPRD